jgi:hypothetical protein
MLRYVSRDWETRTGREIELRENRTGLAYVAHPSGSKSLNVLSRGGKERREIQKLPGPPGWYHHSRWEAELEVAPMP